MSFYLPSSKIELSHEANVAPGAVILAEGLALVRVNNAQSQGVLPSTGAATDVFAGFSFAGTSALPFPESLYNKVEQFVVPSTGSVTLSLTPIAGQVFVFDNTTGGAVSPAPTVTGNVVSGLTAGDTVTVTYKYQMTIVQERVQFGDVQPGGYVGSYIGQIGVITRGQIFTSEFDASKNWAAATSVKLAASGQLTDQTGTGVTIPAQIIALPGQDVPFLGIEFDIL